MGNTYRIIAKYKSINAPAQNDMFFRTIFKLNDDRFIFVSQREAERVGDDEEFVPDFEININTADYILNSYDAWAQEDIRNIINGNLLPYWKIRDYNISIGQEIECSCSALDLIGIGHREGCSFYKAPSVTKYME